MPTAAGRYPAVIEFLPYRKDDFNVGSAPADVYFASHGYVSARIDARGTGVVTRP